MSSDNSIGGPRVTSGIFEVPLDTTSSRITSQLDFLDDIDVDHMSFIEEEKTNPPERDNKAEVQIKTGFKDYLKNFVFGNDNSGNMFSRALGFIKDKISGAYHDYKGAKLEKAIAELKQQDELKATDKTFSELKTTDSIYGVLKEISSNRKHTSAEAGRIFVENLFLRFIAKPEDRLAFDRDTPEGKKIYGEMFTFLVSMSLASDKSALLTTEQATENLTKMIHNLNKGLTNTSPREVNIAIGMLMEVRELVKNPEQMKEFTLDVIKNRYSEFGKGAQFMRENGTVNLLATRGGFEKLVGLASELKNEVTGYADSIPNKVQIAFGKPHHIMVSAEMKADAMIELTTKFVDITFGDKGINVKNRLGDEGVQFLRDGALLVLENAKKEGKTDAEANKLAKTFYQNALLLRGLMPQMTALISDPSANLSDTSRMFVMNASKTIQVIANDATANTQGFSDELKGKLLGDNPPPLMSRLDGIYNELRLPKLPDDLDEIDIPIYAPGGDEEFVQGLGNVLQELNLVDNAQPNNGMNQNIHEGISDGLFDVLKDIDNPVEGQYVEGISNTLFDTLASIDNTEEENGEIELNQGGNAVENQQANIVENGNVNVAENEPVQIVQNRQTVEVDEEETGIDTENNTNTENNIDDDDMEFDVDAEFSIHEDGDVTPEDQIERNMREIVTIGEKQDKMTNEDRERIKFLLEDNKALEQQIQELY